MKTTSMDSSISKNYSYPIESKSIISAFYNWTVSQQKNRLAWLGVALTSHGCIITPLTVAIILLNGINIYLFMLSMVAMVAVLVVNLAASPTKVTIPVYFLSVILDLAVMFISLANMSFN